MALFKSSYKVGAEAVKLSERLAKKYYTPKSVSEIEDTVVVASSKGTNKAGREIAESVQTVTEKNAAKNVGGNLANKAKVSVTSLIAGTGIGALGTSIVTSVFGGGGEEPTPDPTPKPRPKQKYIFDPYTGIISPFDGEEGGTAYLSGDPYGESGSETVLDETVETLKEYAPYLIGFGVIVVIVALITGNRKGKGKKGGNRK